METRFVEFFPGVSLERFDLTLLPGNIDVNLGCSTGYLNATERFHDLPAFFTTAFFARHVFQARCETICPGRLVPASRPQLFPPSSTLVGFVLYPAAPRAAAHACAR
jgi:hypothetical protein